MTPATTTKRPATLIEMFTDATAGESYAGGRLVTSEQQDGSVVLIGYGWLKLAEYDEEEGEVTVFFGHKSVDSRTISRHLNRVVDIASGRRTVTISHESPVLRKPNEGAKYINAYVGDTRESTSAVERAAMETVRDSLSFVQDRFL